MRKSEKDSVASDALGRAHCRLRHSSAAPTRALAYVLGFWLLVAITASSHARSRSRSTMRRTAWNTGWKK